MSTMTLRRAAIFYILLAWASAARADSERYDVVVRDGRIVDGAGNPWYRADIGIRGGRIVAIGALGDAKAARTIDADGAIVAPGFIDVHTHVEDDITRRSNAENFLFDGVTTLVTGNCGSSETDLDAFFAAIRKAGVSPNVATLIGHNSVRRAVMGTVARTPTEEEQSQMEALAERAMRAGAVGLSTGLIYIPGTYSETAEIVGLARVASRFGGIYVSHIRNEGEGVFDAVTEAVEIGRQAKLPVEISHFKITAKRFWGETARLVDMVEKARAEGLDVTADQYPYTASSTSLSVLLPSWAHEGGRDELKKRLDDHDTRRRIAREMETSLSRIGRKSLDYAVVASCGWDRALDGRSVSDINRSWGRRPRLVEEIETVIDMMYKGGAQMVYHSMSERDVGSLFGYGPVMVGSDAGIPEMGTGVPHPRGYGTNARVLARFVRERRLLRLEEAIRKMTSLPAQRFRLMDRGLVRPGHFADLAIFDDLDVTDTATFERPHAYARGFRYVLVNGTVVIEGGRHTGARPGQVLLGPGAHK